MRSYFDEVVFIKRLIVSVFLLLLLWPVTGAAQIYRCEDERGRAQFSDKPCAEGAVVIELKTDSSGISMGSQGDYSGVYRASAQRDLRRKIKLKQGEIERLELSKERAVARIKREQLYSNNNLAGAVRDDSLAAEMQAIVRDYNGRIGLRVNELGELRRLLR